ncbi:hypothetical protein AT15_01455 [Kosmotoga arenicorallina S304]|uniref:PNPLA domain-containing protein n=2 Tax=Kosmotoga arenicorallina TaxID=688066 RepID=A0A176JZZ5_9BACT|nr:hypothetical protein AT15_01455 [Kosmotoga arenicorallina S304]
MLLTSAGFALSESWLNEKIGLVLSGGGGRGAYEIGVWKALSDLNIHVGGIYGTSVGSINAAGILMGDFKMLRDIWLSMNYDDVMDVSPEVKKIIEGNLSSLSATDIARAMRSLFTGIDVTPLRNELSKLIDEERVRSSGVDYGLVAYSLSKMKPTMLYLEDIPDGQLVDYILASSNFPVFKRETFGGERYIDGGIYSNIPIELAINRGYKKIIAVDIGTYGLTDILNFLGRYRNKSEIIFIKPRKHFGTVLTFDPEVSRKYLLEGYLDTLRVFGILKGEKYYIFSTEDIFKELFMSLSAESIEELFGVLDLHYSNTAEKEYLYNMIFLPYLESYTGIFGKPSSDTSYILLEQLASFWGIEWLKLYDSYELLKEIIIRGEAESNLNIVQSFLKNLRYKRLFEGLKILLDKGKPLPKKEKYLELKKTLEELVTID